MVKVDIILSFGCTHLLYYLAPPDESQQTLAFIPQAPLDPNSNKFFCDLCKVGAPSQSQIDMHLNGKNHKVLLNEEC